MSHSTHNKDFYDVLADLKKRSGHFDAKSLQELPYDQLILAASGNAGVCRCSLEDVINEKQERRAVLLAMPKKRFERIKLDNLIAADLQEDRIVIDRTAPSWHEMSSVAKLYFKLSCLENHPYDAFARLTEVVNLLREAEGALPQQLAFSIRLEFQSALLSKPSEDWVKDTATKTSNMLYGFVTGPEIEIVDRLELRDYVCTQGCFYPLSE